MSSGPNEKDLMEVLNAEIQHFRDSDHRREKLLTRLVTEYGKLEALYLEKCNDYEQERKSLAMWQRENRSLEAELNQLKLSNESNPIAFVIIDGDGAIFRDELLARGAEGGTDCAFELLTQIRKHIKTIHPETSIDNLNIMVQVIVNFEGLAKTLHASGILEDGFKQLTAFAHAFGQAQSLFSFIDVGPGKERTDHKIRETLRVMSRLSQCKHVIFGPCHDNGYLPVLEPYKQDPIVGPKLSLLEASPATPGFIRLGLPLARFPTVFRPELITKPNIQISTTGLSVRNTGIPGFGNSASSPASIFSFMSPGAQPGSAVRDRLGSIASMQPFPPAPSTSSPPQSVSSTSPAPTAPSSYASVGTAASATAPLTIDIAPKKTASASLKYYYVNASSERLDEELPRHNPVAYKSYNDKKAANGRNFCNRYHLAGYCEEEEHCKYEHGPRLKGQELLVQKHRARGTYCDNGIGCEDFDCYYAHHCRFGRACGIGDACKFNDTHHMDLTPVAKIYENGTKERLIR
ncbi:hypothetical protein PpBr36_01517 [Pyricularia pennisetigena]|uniref:hypothetical protein n=1 Tax=Pyricularia pennisetigena TaxID=1578925 RepID=UPI00114FC0DE|nr:hypothetical protein PpBr36_01517 [Pyricularia pennisetigena]TLS29486.1 hypothetical protein PpBr36_01517 [Pyricularia pennisetigena]